MKEVTIREGRREDCQSIRDLIQELADFEKVPDSVKISHKDLEKDGFDTDNPLFYCFVATIEDQIIGYALYFYSYSTWTGKALILEDLYVTANYRKKKIGNRLFQTVAKKAVETQCTRMDFVVLDWNPAKEFYENRGGVNLTLKESWQYYRLDHDALEKLIND